MLLDWSHQMLSHKRKKTMKTLYELPSPDSRRCCRKDATGGVELREAIEALELCSPVETFPPREGREVRNLRY